MVASEHDLAYQGPLWGVLRFIARWLALAGGLMFTVLIIISLVSIVSRKLGSGSITGDVELMQTGTAVAAAAFMPYCTLVGDHLRVDFFTERLPEAMQRYMDAVCELILGAVFVLLAWRTTLSAFHLHDTGDTTTLLSLPLWIPVAAIVPSLALTVLASVWRVRAALGLARYRSRKEQMAVDQGVSA